MTQRLSPVLAFTTQFSARVNALTNEAYIAKPFDRVKYQRPQNPVKFTALWDTGATSSVITERVVQACKLQPTGVARVYTAAGANLCPICLVSIGLPNNVWFDQVRVTVGQLSSDIDILIGMDIISTGDFAITHRDGKTTFSFRYPSMDYIDFTKNASMIRATPKVGRNDPCPCGSGKKYKDCHAKLVI